MVNQYKEIKKFFGCETHDEVNFRQLKRRVINETG
jgi:hypothetical protein